MFGQSFDISWNTLRSSVLFRNNFSGQEERGDWIIIMAMTGEASSGTNWSWREDDVDVEGEHIELRYGDAAKSNYEQWLPIGLIGKPTNEVFPVSWLMR